MIQYNEPWLSRGDRLCCFGDSITHTADGYVSMIAGRLEREGVAVYNAGIPGDKTTSALVRLERDVVARKPSAVLIAFGANDARVGRGKWADEPTLSSETYQTNLVWIIHLCRQQGIRKFCVMPPCWRLEGDEWLENGDVYQPYCRAARTAAESTGSRFAPVDIAFADEWARHPGHSGLLLTGDGLHPTLQGHRLMADTLLRAWGMA